MYPGANMIWMAAVWMITLFLIAATVWTLLVLFSHFQGPSHLTQSPEKILKRRLAAGEIDADEYAKRLAELSKTKRAA